jgi:hypothetical protein
VTLTDATSNFASDGSPDLVAVIKNSGTVTVTASNLEVAADQVKWQIDRDPNDTVDTGTPSVSGSPGATVTFAPSTAGNFRLTAYVDANSNGVFDEGEQLGVLRVAVVQASLLASHFFTEDTIEGQGSSTVVTDPSHDINSSPLRYDADYLLEGGGASRTIGTSAITLGGIGNLLSDNFAIAYPGSPLGTGAEDPGGTMPMVDTQRVSAGASPTGGVTAFRSTWVPSEVAGDIPSTGGRVTQFITGDAQVFTWANFHPTTGSTWGSTSGGISFREFAVGFSSSFPQTYAAVSQATWSVVVIGSNNSGWEDSGSSDVTGDDALQAASSAVQVLGKSYARENRIVYRP